MSEAHVYRRCDLSLVDLATELQTTTHDLSRALNQSMQTSYHDMLARHRVADAGRRLRDPENDRFTIDAIAEASGFASRSAFYGTFRRITGMTPTEFRTASREGPRASVPGPRAHHLSPEP